MDFDINNLYNLKSKELRELSKKYGLPYKVYKKLKNLYIK